MIFGGLPGRLLMSGRRLGLDSRKPHLTYEGPALCLLAEYT